MKILLLLLLLLLAKQGRAGEIEIAHFAAEGYSAAQCDIALDGFRKLKRPTLSFVFRTFRRSGDCPKKFIEKYADKRHSIKIYGTNETCRRGNRFCESHTEPTPGLRAKEYSEALERGNANAILSLRKRTRSLRAWIGANAQPITRVFVVTGLEDDFSTKAYETVIREYRRGLLKKHFKRVILVRNPNGSNANNFSTRGAEYIELHALLSHFGKRRGIWSNDGIDLRLGGREHQIDPSLSVENFRSYARRYLSGGHRVQIWWNTQGIERGGFVAPRIRSFNVNRGDAEVVRRLALELSKEK